MRSKPRLLRRWQFSVGVIAPAAMSLVLTAIAVVAFVVWSTQDTDRQAIAHETELVARAIERQIEAIPHAQQSVAVWGGAVSHTMLQFDKAWIDNNLGVWLHSHYGFDAAAVVDDTDTAIYTMTE